MADEDDCALLLQDFGVGLKAGRAAGVCRGLPLLVLGVQEVEEGIEVSPQPDNPEQQGEQLHTFLNHDGTDPILKYLRTGKIRIVSSNLRRAITTALLAFRERILQRSEKVVVLTALQEASNNPDSLSLLRVGGALKVPWTEENLQLMNMHEAYTKNVDLSQYKGNKDVTTNGLSRIMAFNDWLFREDSDDSEVVVAVGHSLWFRSYFQEFLPHNAIHDLKTKKIANGGAVAFDVKRVILNCGKSNQEIVYLIDQKSIRTLYLGCQK